MSACFKLSVLIILCIYLSTQIMPISESRNFISTRITTRTDTEVLNVCHRNYDNLQFIQPIETLSRPRYYNNVRQTPLGFNRKNLIYVPVTNRTSHVTSLSSLATINVRSLRKRLLNVKHYIYEHDIDIMALTGTWLTSQSRYEALELCSDDAVLYRCDRDSTGGGVAIL